MRVLKNKKNRQLVGFNTGLLYIDWLSRPRFRQFHRPVAISAEGICQDGKLRSTTKAFNPTNGGAKEDSNQRCTRYFCSKKPWL